MNLEDPEVAKNFVSLLASQKKPGEKGYKVAYVTDKKTGQKIGVIA